MAVVNLWSPGQQTIGELPKHELQQVLFCKISKYSGSRPSTSPMQYCLIDLSTSNDVKEALGVSDHQQ
jgi:hypothetical protein